MRQLLARLRRDEIVQNRQLRTWLGAEAYAEYEADWAEQQALRAELKAKPPSIVEYERRLKLATMAYNKAETASNKRRTATAEKLYAQAESLFEDALEHLRDITDVEPSLQIWFDRQIDWEMGGDITADAASVPRVVTSRSMEGLGGGLRSALRTKREAKMDAVERALRSLEASLDTPPLSDNSRKLNEFLKAADG